jgi:hypothetical protein
MQWEGGGGGGSWYYWSQKSKKMQITEFLEVIINVPHFPEYCAQGGIGFLVLCASRRTNSHAQRQRRSNVAKFLLEG